MAGPYEFLPLGAPEDKHGPDLARTLATAYDALGHDLLVLLKDEADWLASHGAPLPGGAESIGARVGMRVVSTPGGDVGFVLFPRLPKNSAEPMDMTVEAVRKTAASLKDRTRLVVGISPWGALGEKAYIQQAPGSVDILLGAGPGPGLAGRFVSENKTFWARAYSKGRSMHVLRIGQWPQRQDGWQWEKDGNIRLDFKVFKEDVPDDPAMRKLLNASGLPR